MSMWEEYKFANAYFIDSERENIKVTFLDGEVEIPHIMPFDETEADWSNLMKVTSIDDIHEATAAFVKGERKSFEQTVILIAKKEGLIFTPTSGETKKWPALVKTLIDTVNDEDLFALKLALFELEQVRSSTDTALKTKLRKSKTKFDVLRAAFEIFEAIPEVVEPVVEKKVSKKK
jgi:hypothetical protein